MTDYQYALFKLRQADNLEALDRLDQSVTRCYDNGVFTPQEFMRLDDKILTKRIQLENAS